MATKIIKLGVSGALGKMGGRILSLASQDKDFQIVLALEMAGHSELGKVIFNTEAVSNFELIKNIDGLIDFSSPQATLEHLEVAVCFKKAIVIGTTGFSDEQKKVITLASKKIPIIFSPNMSIGVNLLFYLVAEAAQKLSSVYKVSMTEAHHIHKKDAPSGTAKFLADIVKKERDNCEIDIKSIREGEIVGDHEVIFYSPFDTIKLSHSAKTRDIFAQGALCAMKWLVDKPAGLYSMQDVFKK